MTCIQSGALLSTGQLTLIESGAFIPTGYNTPIESGAILRTGGPIGLEVSAILPVGQPSTWASVFFHNPPGFPGGPTESWTPGQGAGFNGTSGGVVKVGKLWVPAMCIKREEPIMKFFAYGSGGGELTQYVSWFSVTESLNQPVSWDVILVDRDRKFTPVGGDYTELTDTGGVGDGNVVNVYFQIELHFPDGQVWKTARLIQSDYDWAGEARKTGVAHLTGTCLADLMMRDKKWSAPDLDAGTMLNAGIKDTLSRVGITKADIRTPDSVIPVQYHRFETTARDVFEDQIWVNQGCWRIEDDRMVVEPLRHVDRADFKLNSAVHLRALRIAKSTRELVTRYFCDVAIEEGGWSKEIECRGRQCVGRQKQPLGAEVMTAQPQPLKIEQGDLKEFVYWRGDTTLNSSPVPGGQYNGAALGPADQIAFTYEPAFSMQVGIGGGGIPPTSFEPYYRFRVKGRLYEENPTIPFSADLRANSVDNPFKTKFGLIQERIFHQLLSSKAMSQNLTDLLLEVSCRRTMPAQFTCRPVNPWIRPNTIIWCKDWLSRTDMLHYVESRTISGPPRKGIAMSLETTTRLPI